MKEHPGHTLRQAISQHNPLQLLGIINAYAALLAKQAGAKALYLSGAGVANANFALPDLGMTSVNDVLETVEKITAACELPLLVDVDTGWGSPLNVRRSIKLISKAGAAGAHIEDQQEAKRCGHRDHKHLVSTKQMCGRIKAALDGRVDDSFVVIARTDAFALEGMERALDRALEYQETGADAIFAEALTSLEQYTLFCKKLKIPVLANMTEFGKTPLFTTKELAQAGVKMVIYPLSAFRAMNAAALKVFNAILSEGTQQSVVNLMQNRQELYQCLNYETYENELEQYLEMMENENGNN